MKTGGIFESRETKDNINKFLKQFNIEIAYDMEELLKNPAGINSSGDMEAVIIHEAAVKKEQCKKLLYNIRSLLPEVLILWCCKEQDKDPQFEAWAFSAVGLRDIIYINEKGEIAVNLMLDALNSEHERLKRLEEEKNQKAGPDNISKRDKQPVKPKIVEKVVEKKVIVEKEIIIDRPRVVKGLLKIAAFSVSPGAGSTSMAVRLGEYLGSLGKTAVIEVDKSDSLQHAKLIPNCEYRSLPRQEDLDDAMYELYRCGFNIIITDYGCLFKTGTDGTLDEKNESAVNRILLREFIKADVKIGMAFTAPWHIGRLKFFARGSTEFEGLCGKPYEEMCFLTDGETARAQKILHGVRCFPRASEIDALIRILLPEIAPKQQKQPKKIFGILPGFDAWASNLGYRR
ncbi:hypothetical protein LY28_03744 [Ruminiclostridium sufflavum DSM 19573]|uniref:Uncharacterized protein n=1 Tax=Ruminiclostridium sufflavum DSM 19573 TaxID=1121337 RepID=A0A318XGZ2_9FIRM|nr:hypothetical protein [Ruminiclostridium sufflavum]PYG84239.1 hypothetical protein LY28_03744 [Ruminiclostridium sufflavum DSM 19573]